MAKYDYDLFDDWRGLGRGPRRADCGQAGSARVAIAEEYRIGGTCVIRGCVPKKLLVYGSRYGSELPDAEGFGWTCDNLTFDWPTLMGNVRREVDRLSGAYTRTLERTGVTRFLTQLCSRTRTLSGLPSATAPFQLRPFWSRPARIR